MKTINEVGNKYGRLTVISRNGSDTKGSALWLCRCDCGAEWAKSHGYDENAPKGKCTLDRIDPNGNYCPDNCRFSDMNVQQNNRRDRHNDVQVYLGKDGIYHCGAKVRNE